jgi:hypothetical protein
MTVYFLWLLLASALLVIIHLLTRRSPRAIPKEVEDHVASVLAHASNVDFTSEEEEGAFYDVSVDRGRFQGKVVAIAKAEFGYLQRTESNRKMVRKFMRDFMRERGMRPTHIAQHLDVSVACFFIPSEQDCIAHQVGATRDAHTQEGVINTLWESYYGPIARMLGFQRD